MKNLKPLLLLLAPALFLLTLAPVVPAAHASPPNTGSGSFSTTSETVTSARLADGNLILTLHRTIALTGISSGTQECDETAVLRLSTFEATFADLCTFAGVYAGRPGTCVVRSEGLLSADGSFHGRSVGFACTGELVGLRSRGIFEGASGVGTYSDDFHFDPS